MSASLPLLSQDTVLGMLLKFLVLKALLFPKNEEISKKIFERSEQVEAKKLRIDMHSFERLLKNRF